MKTIKIIIPVILILLSISCNQNILDITPQDRIAESAVWTDVKLIQAYHSELYNAIPHGFYTPHMYSKYTDEAYNAAPCCCAAEFRLNTLSPDNISQYGSSWCANQLYYWDRAYEYVRKINVFIEKMGELEIDLDDKDQMIAEAKFLRAFIYFKQIKRHGGVPLIDQVYNLGDEPTFVRSSFDECVTFIEKDLTEAIPNLPDRYQSTDGNYGRATVDACLALRSRMYLYAASPLFNPTNDQQRWVKAANAAEALLNRGYELYPDYNKLFQMSQGDSQDEVIFSRGFTSTNFHQAPMHNFNRRYEAYGGWWGSNGPSQNLIDDYDMINGEPPFLADGVTVNPASGYIPEAPFQDRDPRFEATILHDDMYFRGDYFEMWISEDGSSWATDSYKNTGDNPRTNTVLLKFMPEEGPFNWDAQFTMQWPHFRLAEIYLNYAEAKFELGDEGVAREYVSKVRARAGMPALPATVTGEELRRRIYNERRIELAFENQRFFDVRRWKISTETENSKIETLDIYLDLNTGVKRYDRVVLLDKTGTYEEYMNLLPIARDEIQNTGLTQTPGWQ